MDKGFTDVTLGRTDSSWESLVFWIDVYGVEGIGYIHHEYVFVESWAGLCLLLPRRLYASCIFGMVDLDHNFSRGCMRIVLVGSE